MNSKLNRAFLFASVFSSSAGLFMGCTPTKNSSETALAPKAADSRPNADSDTAGYWTCSMHSQIHAHDPGKCPICGMQLIHVHPAVAATMTTAAGISNSVVANAQIATYKVTRQDMDTGIPVSGRMTSSRQVSFQIYESDLASVKPGFSFTGTASIAPGQLLKGHIHHVDNLIDPTSRTVQASGTLESSSVGAGSESAFSGVISNTLKNQIVVPENAVLRAGIRDLVYVFSENHKLQPREVQVGQKGKNQFQILSGLKEGEVISNGPNFLIDSEAKLRGQE